MDTKRELSSCNTVVGWQWKEVPAGKGTASGWASWPLTQAHPPLVATSSGCISAPLASLAPLPGDAGRLPSIHPPVSHPDFPLGNLPLCSFPPGTLGEGVDWSVSLSFPDHSWVQWENMSSWWGVGESGGKGASAAGWKVHRQWAGPDKANTPGDKTRPRKIQTLVTLPDLLSYMSQ